MSAAEEPVWPEWESIMDGTVDEVSSISSKIIRVFLSSTFSDMTEERNLLLKEVYPKIQEYTKRKYGVNFQMVDMRWGVTNEAQNDHMTSICCLKEIRNCHRVSIGPNFVMLIGQKYGYRPIPAFIDAEEYEIMYKLLQGKEEDLSALDVWYLKDENASPSQYVLQPINSILKNYDSSDDDLKKVSRDEWQDTFDEIQDLLMTGADLAFDAGQIGGQTKEKYFISVTQEEIDIGNLLNKEEASKKCLCFMREIEDLKANIGHHRAVKFIDLCPKEDNNPAPIDTEAQDLLGILKDQTIPQALPKENIVKLTTKWSERGGINSTDNADYLNNLAKVFYDRMVWLIDQNIVNDNVGDDDHVKEVVRSLQIRNEWSRIFFGRTNTLKAVEKYLKDTTNRCPFVVYGESGCGKTAVIAMCARATREWMSSAKPVIVMRFLGTSPSSSHILLTLISLCTQICDAYRLDKTSIPTDYKDVVAFFHGLLKKIESQQRTLILYLDSLDQLSTSFEPQNLQWLPKRLPAHVKIVVSLIPSVNNLLKRFKQLLGDKQSNVEPLAVLGDTLTMDIIHARLADAERTITDQQTQLIAKIFTQCSLPLFSRIMIEEILTWKSYTTVTSNMVSSSIKDALSNFFHRLEMAHGRVLVQHTLSYITAAKEGVSEMELLDLLSLDDDVLNSVFLFWLPPARRLPPFLWTKLRIDLNVFLVTRDSGDVEVFSWYHRLFKEAATERYLSNEAMVTNIHANMAEYFMGVWSGKDKPFKYSAFLKSRLALTCDEGEKDRNVPEQPLIYSQNKNNILFNKRKLTELPYHLIKCKNFENHSDLCTFNYTWLWTKISAYGLQLLLEDMELSQKYNEDSEIQALLNALRIAGHTLNEHPECLSIELTGRLFDLFESMPKVRRLMQQCDVDARSHTAVMCPSQLFEIPVSALVRTLEGSTADVGDTIFIKNCTEVISIAIDGSITKWDLAKGCIIKEINFEKLKVINVSALGLIVSRDEQYVLVESRPSNTIVLILDVETMEVVGSVKSPSIYLNHNIIAGGRYGCICNAIYELSSGKKVHDLNSYRKIQSNVTSFVTIAFSACDKYLLIGGDKFVDIFEIEKAKRVAQLPVPNSVSTIEVTADKRLAIVGLIVDCHIKIFDINTESSTFGAEIVTYDPIQSFPNEIMAEDSYATKEVSEICLSNKQRMFVSLVKRKYPIVWSLKNVSEKPRLLKIPKGGDVRYFFKVQFSSDDQYVLAAELSPNIYMWNSFTGDMMATFQAHKNNVHDLVLSTRENVILTTPHSGTELKLWDLQKVLKTKELSSKKNEVYSVKSVTFSSESNQVFLSRIEPPKSSKAYHYIDYFGIDVIDLTTGRTGCMLPFDKYGALESVAISKDNSIFVTITGYSDSNTMTVFNMNEKRLLASMNVQNCKGIRVSAKGEYLSVFTDFDGKPMVRFFSLPDMEERASCDNCFKGMFTKKNAFVGITDTKLMIRETIEDDETLDINLQADVIAVHYCDVTEVLLVSLDDGHQVTATAFKTEGFGAIGTLTNVAQTGVSDIASDGSICIDSDLQVFELERCKRVKRLLPMRGKSDITSVRLSKAGEHAVFIDNVPSNCVKVCRVSDSTIISTSYLHCVPEFIEMVTALNLIVVVAKDKNLFVLALRDCKRTADYTTRMERIAGILGVEPSENVRTFEMSEKIREQIKKNAKVQQTRLFTVELNGRVSNNNGVNGDQTSHRSVKSSDTGKSMKSSSCRIL